MYRDLETVAQERGLTPAGWIAATLPGRSGLIDEQPLSKLLQGLVGAVDSRSESRNGRARPPLSDLIARRLMKQGLREP